MDEDREDPGRGPDDEAPDGAGEFRPPLDFSSIIFPFYTQAIVKLGLIEDPLKGGSAPDLEFAKRLIDLLDLLKERTAGNLEPKEADFLESCLIQLKMHYMEKADLLKV